MVRKYIRKDKAETKRHRDLIRAQRTNKCRCGNPKYLGSKRCNQCDKLSTKTKIKTPKNLK